MSQLMRLRPGFTVAEIVVVMIIAVIIGAMSMGRFSNIETGSQLNRATKAIQTDLQNSFSLAARYKQPVRISWDTTKMAINITDRAQTTYFRRVGLGIA